MRLQQAMEKRLKETSDRWDGERRRMSADANQAMKVSVANCVIEEKMTIKHIISGLRQLFKIIQKLIAFF